MVKLCLCWELLFIYSYPVLVMCYQRILSSYVGIATTKSLIIKSMLDSRGNHCMSKSFQEALCTQGRFREGKEIYLKWELEHNQHSLFSCQFHIIHTFKHAKEKEYEKEKVPPKCVIQ